MHTSLTGKQKIKIVYIRSPYCYWPLFNKSDNILPPLSFPALAGYIRDKMPNVEQKIIDCMGEEIGFKTLRRMLEEYKPDVVCIGEMICHHKEGLKTVRMAKELNPNCVTVAGGTFFSHMVEYGMKECPELDLIVRYEGEETFRELLEFLLAGKDLSGVLGIVYRDGDRIVSTHPRPLIQDLNTLPIPAYDLIPVTKYAPAGAAFKRAITIQGNRGCPFACDFCSWTAMESEHKMDENGKITFKPGIRLKDPLRVADEVGLLYEKYGVRYLFWVEGTWNYSVDWLDTFCSELIRRKYTGLGWWAFFRPDMALIQEKKGVLEKMVRAGLRHLLMGAERGDQAELVELGKRNTRVDAFREVCILFERKYPQVFRQCTFIAGMHDDTPEKLERLHQYTLTVPFDFGAIHPFMPYPGTPSFEKYDHLIEERDYTKWDMMYPVMRTETMTREEVATWCNRIQQDFVLQRKMRFARGLLSPFQMRRRLHWWFLYNFSRLVIRDAAASVMDKKKFKGFSGVQDSLKPSWYES